jgi:hypothetical protein
VTQEALAGQHRDGELLQSRGNSVLDFDLGLRQVITCRACLHWWEALLHQGAVACSLGGAEEGGAFFLDRRSQARHGA